MVLKGHIGLPLLLDENGTHPFLFSHHCFLNGKSSSSSSTSTATAASVEASGVQEIRNHSSSSNKQLLCFRTQSLLQLQDGSTCFIANRLKDWYEMIIITIIIMTNIFFLILLLYRYMETIHHTDVCHTIELKGIQWDKLITSPYSLLLNASSSLHISRRGGIMLRLIFPRGTQWSLDAEQAVLHDSNRLMETLRGLLRGKSVLDY